MKHSLCVFCGYSEKWTRDRLDLHALFEAAGNGSAERRGVLDSVDELTRAGMLEECGGDYYALTERGKRAIAQP